MSNAFDLLGFDYLLTDNARLNETWRQYESPVISYSTIDSEGYGAYIFAYF